MGKKRKNRESEQSHRFGEHTGHSGAGLGETLLYSKRRRLSEEDSGKSVMQTFGDSPRGAIKVSEDINHQLSTPEDDGDEWQVVKPKGRPVKHTPQQNSEKNDYSALVFHGKQSVPLRIADLQNLVLYALADGVAPIWVAFKNARDTRKVAVLMVPGLEMDMFDGSIGLETFPVERGEPREVCESINNDITPNLSKEVFGISSSEDHRKEQFESWKQGKPLKEPQFWPGNPITMNAEALPAPIQPITSIFSQVWPIRSPGDSRYAKLHSPIQAMLISPIPRSKMPKDHKGPRPPAEEKSFRSVPTPITTFIHSLDELREAEYPIHPALLTNPTDAAAESTRRATLSQTSADGWVDTSVTTPTPIIPSPSSPHFDLTRGLTIFALDCEMVLTTDNQLSLARVSLLAYSTSTVVLDTYVLPALPITNYFTQFSGITPSHLLPTNNPPPSTLSSIQSQLLTLLTPSTILLGHSLSSDLAALKLTHPFLIDTTLLYPHPRGLPLRSSLKFLAQKYLNRPIQDSTAGGHNSVEDALATLDLVKLKCAKGPKYGTSAAHGESLFLRLGRAGRTSALVDWGHDPSRGLGKDATYAFPAASDAEIVAATIRAVNGDKNGDVVPGGGVDFVWARLRELEFARGWSNDPREKKGQRDGLPDTVVDGDITTLAAIKIDTTAARSGETATTPANDATVATADAHTTTATTADTSTTKTTAATANGAPRRGDRVACAGAAVALMRDVFAALPARSLFVVYSGTGDAREVGRLQALQREYQRAVRMTPVGEELGVAWGEVEERMLRDAVDRVRGGVGFMVVK